MYLLPTQRFPKQRPYAEACWTDEPAYIGPGQDVEAHDITDRDNASKARNLSGGWFDAGDTDKYVTFAAQAVHQLLSAFQENPAAFTDDFDIPESGNGVPDLLDEVKWELAWLKRMQNPDGSAALKVGEIVYASAAPPSSDHDQRFYIPTCSSATIAVAGMFAHASYVFGTIGALSGDAAELRARAVAAWNNYQHLGSKQIHCDAGIIHSAIADWSRGRPERGGRRGGRLPVCDHRRGGLRRLPEGPLPRAQAISRRRLVALQAGAGRCAALLYQLAECRCCDSQQAILADKLNDMRAGNQIYRFNPDDDLYRAFLNDPQYHWGSNMPRAGYGNTNMDALVYGLDARNAARYRTRALEILHYFHGVNPFAMVYLSNMYSSGATRSANEIYHTWYWHGTRWSDALTSECGPAPGYVPGGPNANAVRDGVPGSLVPPAGQPPQKSYRDWNMPYPESSWAVTEPAIYYQSAYVKLLSKFVR